MTHGNEEASQEKSFAEDEIGARSDLRASFLQIAADCDLASHMGSNRRRSDLLHNARYARRYAESVMTLPELDIDRWQTIAADLRAQADATIGGY